MGKWIAEMLLTLAFKILGRGNHSAAPHEFSVEDERKKLDTAFPNWGSTIESIEYQLWLAGQSEDIQRMANSWYAADSIAVLMAFETRRGSVH